MSKTTSPAYPVVYQWLESQAWLPLQYTPADMATDIGATLYALSPAGVEWRFHFNTHNVLSGWDNQQTVRVSGEIQAEIYRP